MTEPTSNQREPCWDKIRKVWLKKVIKINFLFRYIVEHIVKPLGETLWIGLNDINHENHWTWNDGAILTTSESQWKLGQPNNYKDQDCAEIDISGLWGDLSCSGRVTAYALCEKDISH